jgi:hypothetical protein
MEAHASFGGLDLWVWLVAVLVLGYLLILANQKPTDVNEKPQNKKPNGSQLGEMDDRYVEFFDEEDELIEEFLIIDLLDEEEEEYDE